MQLTADMILTDFGTVLPLDRRRRDALAAYVRKAAWADGVRSAQRWAELRWALKDYEAKDLLKGNASEAIWERIVKHPNGGWSVVLPIMGSVIGQSLEDWMQTRLVEEGRRLARERERYEADRARLGQMAREVGSLLGVGAGGSAEPDARRDWAAGPDDGDLGRRDHAKPVAEPRQFAAAPKKGGR